MTKQKLDEEVEQLRSTLEQAHVLISDALGYETDEESEESEVDEEE